MECPNCGAELKGSICEYCGTYLPDIEETEKKASTTGCPHCGCEDISYWRERKGNYSVKVMAACQNCGNVWESESGNLFQMTPKIVWWIFGWVLCFPIPATILLLRAKSIPKVVKYIIITAMWIGFAGYYFLPWIDFWFI